MLHSIVLHGWLALLRNQFWILSPIEIFLLIISCGKIPKSSYDINIKNLRFALCRLSSSDLLFNRNACFPFDLVLDCLNWPKHFQLESDHMWCELVHGRPPLAVGSREKQTKLISWGKQAAALRHFHYIITTTCTVPQDLWVLPLHNYP